MEQEGGDVEAMLKAKFVCNAYRRALKNWNFTVKKDLILKVDRYFRKSKLRRLKTGFNRFKSNSYPIISREAFKKFQIPFQIWFQVYDYWPQMNEISRLYDDLLLTFLFKFYLQNAMHIKTGIIE